MPALDDFEWSEADYWLLRMLPRNEQTRFAGCHPLAGDEVQKNHVAVCHVQTIGDGDEQKQRDGYPQNAR